MGHKLKQRCSSCIKSALSLVKYSGLSFQSSLNHTEIRVLSCEISGYLSCVAVKIKKPIQTKFRMPVLNWVALKPSQINGTVFNDIDDEAILQVTKQHFKILNYIQLFQYEFTGHSQSL